MRETQSPTSLEAAAAAAAAKNEARLIANIITGGQAEKPITSVNRTEPEALRPPIYRGTSAEITFSS